jgi:hypothetical protein
MSGHASELRSGPSFAITRAMANQFSLLRSALAGAALTTCAARPGEVPKAPAPNQGADQTVIAETRATLATLVAVDTSHGHETDLLRPFAQRFRDAGIAVELIECSAGRGILVDR